MPPSSGRSREALILLGVLVFFCLGQAAGAFSTPFASYHRKLGDVDIDEELLDYDEDSLVSEMRRLISDMKTNNRNSSSARRELFAGVAGGLFCLKGGVEAIFDPNPYDKT